MQSIKEIYKIGAGPSSSHTLACERACKLFIKEYGKLTRYYVELYGSLSLTGKGHWTDTIIKETLSFASVDVEFKLDWNESFPNGFYIYGYDEFDNEVAKWTVFSIGGGSIDIKEIKLNYNDQIYFEKNFNEIKERLLKDNITLLDYALIHEPDLREYISDILDAMTNCVKNGITTEGVLPGKLNIIRCAKSLYTQSEDVESSSDKKELRIFAYAYAANEENACRKQVVTAPTLGACGVMASVISYCYYDMKVSREKLIDALIIGGIFGNIIKRNASISGAMGGCQAEIGSACAMAASALAYINDLNLNQIEYAAECSIEHNLGLTCDPVGGYVIIPCIERNAMGARRAFEAVTLAKYMSKVKENLISFDMVVQTMDYTGKKMAIELRETSLGGLAREYPIED